MTCFNLDDLSRMAGEERAAKEKQRVPPDPFKAPKAKAGRARPRVHISKIRRQTSLGGKHS